MIVIPFIDHIGIKDDKLTNHKEVQNHIGSIHAGAIFSLAEYASGEYLSQHFNSVDGSYIALLRESSIKYKKIATLSDKSRGQKRQRERG